MSFIARFWNTIRNPVRYVGRDLEGNKFFETRCPNNPDRPRRVVEYHQEDEVWHYIGGRKRLPAQWSAWLSHTRKQPPSLEELQVDLLRQRRLAENVAQIEARDRAEAEERLRLHQEDNRRALEAAALDMTTRSTLPSPEASSSAVESKTPSKTTTASKAAPTESVPETELPAFLTPAVPGKPKGPQGTKFRHPKLDLEADDAPTPPPATTTKTTAHATQDSDAQPKPSSTLPYMPSRPVSETESWSPKLRRRG